VRQRWRHWRHTRPFWGGLLVTLGAAEILLSEKAPLPLVIHIGLQGLAGYLVPVVLLLCGVLLLFHPVQKTFYSILAVVLALGSWITSNMGGFFVGMLLGVIGGCLAFAWQRQDERSAGQRRRRLRPHREPSVGLALITQERVSGAGEPRPAGGGSQEEPSGGETQPIREQAGPGAGSWRATAILAFLLAASSQGPVPATSPTPPTSSSTPNASATPTGTAVPSPSASAAATPSPAATASPSPAPSRKHRRPAPAAGGPVARASAAHWELAAGSAVFTGLTFEGIASVATAAGPVSMLKLSVDSLTFSGGTTLVVRQAGTSTAIRDSSVRLGYVGLYVTRLSGDLNGTRVTFTAARPPPRQRPNMTLTNVIADQPYTVAASLYADALKTAAGRPR
jgi:Family of unknown function (DUF6114)